MKRLVFLTLNLLTLPLHAQQIKITNVLSNIPSSIRGLSVIDDHVAWFSGSNGYAGRTIDGGRTWRFNQIKSFEKVDFRSLYAFDSLHAIVANAGSPASILKTNDGGRTWREVYHNNHPDIFFDGIDFWNEQTGLIYGDPIDGRMMLLKTTDGGETWKEIPGNQRPQLEKGEASFAASGTGIRCVKKSKVIIATGGLISRLWVSENIGMDWTPMKCPIVHGKSSTGIFSIGTNNETWVVVGGDYSADSLSTLNAFYSFDEGKRWIAPKKSTRGYRSCVEFISGRNWLAVGQTGIDISWNNGKTWLPFSDEKGFHVLRKARQGKIILAAGNNKIVMINIDP